MSGSRWANHTIVINSVIKSFSVHFFCVFLPLFLNFICFCKVLAVFVLYCAYLCMKYSLGNSSFLKEISSLSHSVVPSISLHCSPRKVFLSLLAILSNFTFSWVYVSLSLLLLLILISQLFIRPPQTNTLPSCNCFSWEWFWRSVYENNKTDERNWRRHK